MTRAQAMTVAQNMRSGGWSVGAIRTYLADRGIEAAESTVRTWVDPNYALRRRDKRTLLYLRLHGGPVTRELKLRRLCELRNAGLSVTDAARVMRLDFGDALTPHQVRHAERVGRYPKKVDAL